LFPDEVTVKLRLLVLLTVLVTSLVGLRSSFARSQLATKSFPVTVVDDHGNQVRLSARPQRLLSLDPRDTETLFALGLESRVVGDGSQYSEGAAGIKRNFRYASEWPSRLGRDYPIKAKSLPHVEGGYSGTPFNLETISSLRPDLILAPYSKTVEPTYQKLHELGIKVIILDPSSIHGILSDLALVGKATGAVKQAAVVSRAIKKQVSGVKKSLARVHSRPRVYYEIDATNPTQPFTAGPGTFIDEALRLAGGKNVADSVTSCSGTLCYPQFSLEALVQLNPQIILLGDAAYGTTVDSVKARGGWSTIAAVQSGKIFPFNDELVSRAGPRIGVGLKALARVLHPEAFGKQR